jgi:hypothetical protein
MGAGGHLDHDMNQLEVQEGQLDGGQGDGWRRP